MTEGRPLDALEESDFGPLVGTSFRLEVPGGEPQALALADVKPHAYLPPAAGRRQGFSLLFLSPQAHPLPQGIYGLHHDRLGRLELFLVPLGPRGGQMAYEAVFN